MCVGNLWCGVVIEYGTRTQIQPKISSVWLIGKKRARDQGWGVQRCYLATEVTFWNSVTSSFTNTHLSDGVETKVPGQTLNNQIPSCLAIMCVAYLLDSWLIIPILNTADDVCAVFPTWRRCILITCKTLLKANAPNLYDFKGIRVSWGRDIIGLC